MLREGMQTNLDLGAMYYCGLTILRRQDNLKDTKTILLHLMRVAIPPVCHCQKELDVVLRHGSLKSPMRYARNAFGAHSL